MSQENRIERIDRKRLPLFYRLVLKIPVPAIITSVNIPSGIFWAIIFPIFIFLDFFLNIYFLIAFSFPDNVIMFCVVPVVILLIFVRLTADRFIDWWNSAVVGGYTPRELREVLEEYGALRKRKSKKPAETTE
jgi:hypothetical protein